MVDALSAIASSIRPIEPLRTPQVGAPNQSFGDLLQQAVKEVDQGQRAAEAAAEAYATGRTTDVAATMITMERASITLQLMLQVRNRLLEAYQEIQRMQV